MKEMAARRAHLVLTWYTMTFDFSRSVVWQNEKRGRQGHRKYKMTCKHHKRCFVSVEEGAILRVHVFGFAWKELGEQRGCLMERTAKRRDGKRGRNTSGRMMVVLLHEKTRQSYKAP